jgi:hypothetical protein
VAAFDRSKACGVYPAWFEPSAISSFIAAIKAGDDRDCRTIALLFQAVRQSVQIEGVNE